MTQSAMLTLDGEPIAMKSMRISLSMQFKDADQSGQTSSTGNAEQGTKAKELSVSGLVPFKDEKALGRLFELADAKADGGQRHVYRVGSLLAKSVKIRQATFSGSISATEQEGLLAWQVQLTLREYNSVPEKREARAPESAAAVGAGTQGASEAKPSEQAQGDEELGQFERLVKQADSAIGGFLS
ncbi:hypothetical protein D6R50_06500 [Aeromonas veronii]|uniref:Uncharacterized protein n=1 Tax=Aeromonas veronii TaxID=654 RepID=A0A3A9IZI8_AERVE|nr:hypothetical protein [Aeromonas veronii]RKJ84407.1 hypothetical protein D6R50_22385 [Aeromonas veronii]RKJ89964.1 hypothetical protein D6R50_12175 [Aeromonas veronii]RKJ90096.1 hypothetical protein D6R50_12920 [Aeromonas veronii]RKJ92193.1 hypothetical protein D6R50_06500 [Aeromonas veronii]